MYPLPILCHILLTAGCFLAAPVVAVGVGLLLFPIRSSDDGRPQDLSVRAWAGVAVVLLVLQVWHLLMPIDTAVRGIVLGLAGGGVIGSRTWVLGRLRRLGVRRLCGWFVLLAAVAIWLAIHTTQQALLYDTGLYHANAVRWAASFPEVKGLANVHERLGFNSSFFLFGALLNTGPFAGRYHHLALGVLAFLLYAQALSSLRRVRQMPAGGATLAPGSASRAVAIYDILAALPLTVWVVNDPYVNSVSPDGACLLIGLALGRLLLQLFLARSSAPAPELRTMVGGLILLATAGITLKLSFAVFGATAVVVGLVLVGASRWREGVWRWQTGVAVAMGAALVAVWMTRGVVQSGYPLFPSGIGALPVDWRVPDAMRERARDAVVDWAHSPGHNDPNAAIGTAWVRAWFVRTASDGFHVVLPLALGLSGIMAWPLAGRTRSHGEGTHAAAPGHVSGLLLVCVPAFAHVAFVLLTAPDWRFTEASLWLPGLLAWSVAMAGMREAQSLHACLILAAVLFLAAQINPIKLVYRFDKAIGPLPLGEVKLETLSSGMQVYVPLAGDQCWDAPVPCTPFAAPGLTERTPGHPGEGFRIAHPNDPRGAPAAVR